MTGQRHRLTEALSLHSSILPTPPSLPITQTQTERGGLGEIDRQTHAYTHTHTRSHTHTHTHTHTDTKSELRGPCGDRSADICGEKLFWVRAHALRESERPKTSVHLIGQYVWMRGVHIAVDCQSARVLGLEGVLSQLVQNRAGRMTESELFWVSRHSAAGDATNFTHLFCLRLTWLTGLVCFVCLFLVLLHGITLFVFLQGQASDQSDVLVSSSSAAVYVRYFTISNWIIWAMKRVSTQFRVRQVEFNTFQRLFNIVVTAVTRCDIAAS